MISGYVKEFLSQQALIMHMLFVTYRSMQYTNNNGEDYKLSIFDIFLKQSNMKMEKKDKLSK